MDNLQILKQWRPPGMLMMMRRPNEPSLGRQAKETSRRSGVGVVRMSHAYRALAMAMQDQDHVHCLSVVVGHQKTPIKSKHIGKPR